MHNKRFFSYRPLWLVIPVVLLIMAQWAYDVRKNMHAPNPQKGLTLRHPLSLTPLTALPPGTRLTALSVQPGYTYIQLPANYRWIGVDQRSRAVELSSFLLACHNPHDCNRLYYQPLPDSAIRPPHTSLDTLRPTTVPSQAWQPLQDGLVVDLSQPAHWVNSPDSLRLFLPAFPVLLTDSLVLKMLNNLLSSKASLQSLPANRDTTYQPACYPMALFGRLLFWVAPHTAGRQGPPNDKLARLSRSLCERTYTLPWSLAGIGSFRLANPALYDPWSPHIMTP